MTVESNDQAIFVLKVILALGPLAMYFLGLGLVNSQARPSLLSERRDFTLLAVVFIPIITLPLGALLAASYFSLVSGAVAVVGLMYFSLLPSRDQGWVVYNCSPAQCRRLLQQSCKTLGWPGQWCSAGDQLLIQSVRLVITQNALPWLRSVTIRIEPTSSDVPPEHAATHRRAFVEALGHEIADEAMLPSPAGASLVLIGTLLLTLPMWYFFQHFDAIVDVVKRILTA